MHLNGQVWAASEVFQEKVDAILEAGAYVNGRLYGTVELVADDRIEYSVPGVGVVEIWTPLPEPDRDPDGDGGFSASFGLGLGGCPL